MRICVHWPRLGPYHLARLNATHRRIAGEGGTLVALETASQDSTYAWREEQAPDAFQRHQVFPGYRYEDVSPSAMWRGVIQALDALDPDAVAINSYSTPDALAALAWCRRRRRVAVVMMESKADDAPRSAAREWTKRVLLSQFDAALAGGSPQRAYLRQLGFPNALIFEPYDVVDNDHFARGAAEARRSPASTRGLVGLHDEHPFFLASNRFVPRKNLTFLLDAYARYCGAHPAGERPWRLLLLGDGPEREGLEAYASDHGLDGAVFCGFQQIADLPAYYGRAAAFVHPPLVEQWGLVVNEALASGLPVLVSERTGSAQDLVHEGVNGFTFDPEDPQELARQMGTLVALSEAERRSMGERSREIVRAWSPERFADALLDATAAGRRRSDRPLSLTARAVLWGIGLLSREVKSLHAIKD